MYCHLKSYSVLQNHETSCNHKILFSVSLSVSFCMFPCSKGHFIRAYLDTISMTLNMYLVNQLIYYMFVIYSLLYFLFPGFQRLQKDFIPISIHFVGQNGPAQLQMAPSYMGFGTALHKIRVSGTAVESRGVPYLRKNSPFVGK